MTLESESPPTAPQTVDWRDFEAIRAAVEETPRGRWFLAEFAARNRAADTQAVLAEITALGARLDARRTARAGEASLVAEILDEIRAGLARLSPVADRAGRHETQTDPLDAALSTGVGAAEDLARAVIDPPRDVEAIARALALHAVTVQRMRVIVQGLKALETRLIAGRAADPTPAAAPQPQPQPQPQPARAEPATPAFDRLPTRERLALFA